MQVAIAPDRIIVTHPTPVARIILTGWTEVQDRDSQLVLPKHLLPKLRGAFARMKQPFNAEVVDLPPEEPAQVLIEKGILCISTPYDKIRNKDLKEIPGCVFSTKKRKDNLRNRWEAPFESIDEVIQFAEKYRIPVSPAVTQMRDDTLREMNEMVRLSHSIESDMEFDGHLSRLRGYQRTGVEYVMRAKRSFISDEPGLGKTATAIASLESIEDSYPVLVVCPPKLTLNWQKEFQRWAPHREVAITPKKAEFITSPDVTIVPWSILAHWKDTIIQHGFKSVVFDESHWAKTATAQRTKAAKAIGKKIPNVRLNLTGTPITIRPRDYIPQLQMIGMLEHFGGERGFGRRYCDGRMDGTKMDLSGASNLEELNERLRGICYVQRSKKVAAPDLPEAVQDDILVEGDSGKMAEYFKAEDDIVQYVVERAKELAAELGVSVHSAEVRARIKAEAGKHFIRISILRRLAAEAKLTAVYEYVDSLVEAGEKVIIAAHHRDIVSALADRYGGLKIMGGQKSADVEEAKRKFQELSAEEAPVIVLSIQAGKEGHTLTAAAHVVFVELAWTSTDIDQTWQRAHRLGQKRTVFVHYVLCHDTIDVGMFDTLAQRRIQVNAATVGDVPDDLGAEVVLKYLDKALDQLKV